MALQHENVSLWRELLLEGIRTYAIDIRERYEFNEHDRRWFEAQHGSLADGFRASDVV